ncbi:VOC family protein [Croceicoccus ponticola]|uniref:VOC family protein n=1 Tax=Croceicoccus ponticola TaxID=2217664 RepID=A0A437H0X7_9SPHN|nr:VOC family protein [Croceicoccus ponticola]RVQ69290.1 VOC family protein [Croceicoccus ponticola]
MFSHMTVGANDIDASKKFYDATFKAIGGEEGFIDPKGRVIYQHDGSVFVVTKPIDGEPATVGNGCTIGIAMSNPEQANAWHDAGVAAGGTSIEDAPGERAGSGMYLAYLRDPSGNKLCALHRLG